MDFYEQRLTHLRDLGFSPKVIYDIGACKTTWTAQVEQVFKNSSFYLFEANKNQLPFLEKQRHPFFIELLGDQERSAIFYASKINNGGGDSILRENSSFYYDQNCEKHVLQMKTLKSIVEKNKLPQPNLIKIDVQGSEKLVILGGLDIIFSAEVVLLETQLIQYNEGAPLFFEVAYLMDNLGFQMIDILEVIYIRDKGNNKNVTNLDVMFIKKNSKFKPNGILF